MTGLGGEILIEKQGCLNVCAAARGMDDDDDDDGDG